MIEFGSGRGLMSYWMAKASQLEAGQKFILVDKASHRWFSVGTCKYNLGYISHMTWYRFECSHCIGGKLLLQDLLTCLNAVISTNESTRFITGHMVYV